VRRLALVLIDLANRGASRCGLGFGKYPLGLLDAIEELRPLVPADDPAIASLDEAIARFKARLER